MQNNPNSDPCVHLQTLVKDYPVKQVEQYINAFRNDYLSANARLAINPNMRKWPRWCFLPFLAWAGITGSILKTQSQQRQNAEMFKLAAIWAWRYSQGIYQIDPDVLAALASSELNGVIPAEVLLRLPEWSLYIETPGLKFGADDLYGFWAHLEYVNDFNAAELRLLLNTSDYLRPVSLPLGNMDILTALKQNVVDHRIIIDPAATANQVLPDVAAAMQPLVSILLYFCAANLDIDNARNPGTRPANPRPVKTKDGVKLFPAPGPTIWQVGQTTGELLRQGVQDSGAGTDGDRTVRAHLRRGHWHGYWVGPKDQQQFEYRWIHPLIAGGKTAEEN